MIDEFHGKKDYLHKRICFFYISDSNGDIFIFPGGVGWGGEDGRVGVEGGERDRDFLWPVAWGQGGSWSIERMTRLEKKGQ